jgi:hypothetical protein
MKLSGGDSKFGVDERRKLPKQAAARISATAGHAVLSSTLTAWSLSRERRHRPPQRRQRSRAWIVIVPRFGAGIVDASTMIL